MIRLSACGHGEHGEHVDARVRRAQWARAERREHCARVVRGWRGASKTPPRCACRSLRLEARRDEVVLELVVAGLKHPGELPREGDYEHVEPQPPQERRHERDHVHDVDLIHLAPYACGAEACFVVKVLGVAAGALDHELALPERDAVVLPERAAVHVDEDVALAAHGLLVLD